MDGLVDGGGARVGRDGRPALGAGGEVEGLRDGSLEGAVGGDGGGGGGGSGGDVVGRRVVGEGDGVGVDHVHGGVGSHGTVILVPVFP